MNAHARSPFTTPLFMGSCLLALVCLALACVPTTIFAQSFAHPARVAALGGAIPDATVRSAQFFRIALALAALATPLLVLTLVRIAAYEARTRPTTSEPREAFSRSTIIALIAITAFGALGRIVVAQQSLWYDEISAFLSFAIEGPAVAFGSYAVPTNHVPQTIATWCAWALTGLLSELTLRAPALLAGIAAIPVSFLLGDSLQGRRAGFACAFVTAVAPIPILESAEARGYSFVIFASLVAALALARAAHARTAGNSVLFAAACAFAAWSHPVALLLLIAAGMIGLWRDRMLVIASLLAFVGALVLLTPLLGDVLASRGDYVHSLAEQPTVLSREGYEALLGLTLSWSAPVLWPEIFLTMTTLCGAVLIVRAKTPQLQRTRAVLAPFVLAFLLAFVLCAIFNSWIYARFVLFAVPIGVLACTSAMTNAKIARGPLLLTGAFLVVLAGNINALRFYQSKQPIKPAVQRVAELRSATDAVATIGLPDNAVGFYALQRGFDAHPTGFLGSELTATVARMKPRFVIVLYPDRLSAETRATLELSFHRIERFDGWADWGHGAVEVWEATAR